MTESDQTDPQHQHHSLRDLWPRFVSGSVMVLITLGLLYWGPKPFAVLLVFIALMMSWEWGRMVRGNLSDASLLVHASATCAGAVLTAVGHPMIAVIGLLVGAAMVFAMNLNARTASTSSLGVLYVGLPVVALVWFRADNPNGLLAVLFLFAVAWGSDTAAYAGGKMIGGFKLWPSVSPKKTWAGFIFAMVASALVGAVAAHMLHASSMVYLVSIALVLGAISQAGDLAESAMKRGFGVKDASDLIPGHGGFMDRMDGIAAVAVAAGLWALVMNSNAPAKALLFGG